MLPEAVWESQEQGKLWMGVVQGRGMMPVLHTGDEKWRLIGGAIQEWDRQHQ